jgi:hypothetical protein
MAGEIINKQRNRKINNKNPLAPMGVLAPPMYSLDGLAHLPIKHLLNLTTGMLEHTGVICISFV